MERNKYDYVIGIDPDVSESGVAYLDAKIGKYLFVGNMTFPILLDWIRSQRNECRDGNMSLAVVVEAGWVNKSNWHVRKGDNARRASAIGNSTGRNHEVARKIVEMCKHYGMETIEQAPLKLCWKGNGGKISHDEFAYFTGCDKRINQDARDAALLAWVMAELPIKIK